MEPRLPDAALGALETKRDRNGAGEILSPVRPVLLQSDVVIVELEIPLTVEIQPLLPLKLRLRVLGTGQSLAYVARRER
jgi:hypothetical protein